MAKKFQGKPSPYLTVDYTRLGTISLDEFRQAILTDLHVLEDVHGVESITAPLLRIKVTDDYGEPHPVRSLGDGKPIYRMHTRHFRPACWDYEP
jgi:hypothetical protein